MCSDCTPRVLADAYAHSTDASKAIYQVASTVSLTVAQRAKLVAVTWSSKVGRPLLAQLFTINGFSEPSVLSRAAALLDAPRKMRAVERRMEIGLRRSRRLKAKEELAALVAEDVPSHFSLTKSFARILKVQLAKLERSRLEFDLLFYADGPWRGLCDLSHTKPSDWALDFFQPAVFGVSGAVPEGSLVADARKLDAGNLAATLERHPRLATLGYSFVRSKVPPTSVEESAKVKLAEKMPLSEVIWHYEELRDKRCRTDAVVDARLERGEALDGHFSTDNFGKILERLLSFRRLRASFWPRLLPLAEAQLAELKRRRLTGGDGGVASLRVAVLGDASSSMQTAINAACTAGAMMSAIFDARLVFFNGKAFTARCHEMPCSAEQVLRVTEEVRAGGCTSPAAALNAFYQERATVDLFIVVTDEEENTPCAGLRFAPLFAKYRAEVHCGARCVFLSFLRDGVRGGMMETMKAHGLPATQHRFDPTRPDLSKFDVVLGAMLLDVREQAAEASRRDAAKEEAEGKAVAARAVDASAEEAWVGLGSVRVDPVGAGAGAEKGGGSCEGEDEWEVVDAGR